MEHCKCGKEAELAVLSSKVSQLEKRCDIKEANIKAIEAWQNKAIGYVLAFSTILSIAINKFLV